jgi:uncharacterized protein (DUF305 family)
LLRSSLRNGTAALLAAAFTTACATAPQQAGRGAQSGPLTPAQQVALDGGIPPYTRADVEFMQGMIAHHGQALTMAALAPTNGARADVGILAARIDVGQRDEIALMQRWLRQRGETVPDPTAAHSMAGHNMPGHDMSTMAGAAPLMPGMLSAEQMAQLRAARGPEFDRLFLTLMIRHHEGAMEMVSKLRGSEGAGQDMELWRLATDIEADQDSEISRMLQMLEARPPDTRLP